MCVVALPQAVMGVGVQETNIKKRSLCQVRGKLLNWGAQSVACHGSMFAVMWSQAPPLLEACSNDVLGLCPLAQWGRRILETRLIKRVAIACFHDALFNKAKE